MEEKNFKKVIKKILKEYKFIYLNNKYVLELTDRIVIVEDQKSKIGDYYYINFGLITKDDNSDFKNLISGAPDIFGRLLFNVGSKKTDEIVFQIIDENEFINSFKKELDEKIMLFINHGLRSYLKKFPESLSTLTLRGKKILDKQ